MVLPVLTVTKTFVQHTPQGEPHIHHTRVGWEDLKMHFCSQNLRKKPKKT